MNRNVLWTLGAVMMVAVALAFAGKATEALSAFNRAIRLSPNCPANFLRYLGVCYHSMNENELAMSTLKKAVEIFPESTSTKIWLVSTLVEEGFDDESKQVAEEIMRIDPGFSASGFQLKFKDATLNEKLHRNLLKAGLPE